MQEMQVQSLGGEDPLEKGLASHSNILAWKLSWTEESSGLQSVGSQSATRDLSGTHSHHVDREGALSAKPTQESGAKWRCEKDHEVLVASPGTTHPGPHTPHACRFHSDLGFSSCILESTG